MIEKGKISSLQMGIMLYPTIIANALLSVPSSTAAYAKNDMWLSPILASSIGFLLVLVAFKLHQLYPKQTIIQYSEHIIGKILGKVIGFIFLFIILFSNGFTLRQYMDLIVGKFLNHTPMILVGASLVFVCAIAARGGVEVVGRSAQLFIPLYVFSLVIIILPLLSEFKPDNIFPVLNGGILPSIKGAAIPESMFSLFILSAFLLPYVSDEGKAFKWSMISVFAVMLTLVITNLTILFVFGDLSSDFLYPVLVASKYISVADFFENLESVIMAIWVAGTFIKLSVQYYIAILATSQLLGLSDSKMIVFPIGILIILFSFWGIPNLPELASFTGTILPVFTFTVNVIIPLLLLILAVIRKKRNRSKKADSQWI